jgi:hypothetical protein
VDYYPPARTTVLLVSTTLSAPLGLGGSLQLRRALFG